MTREEMDAAIAAYCETGGTVTKCEPSKRGYRLLANRLTVRVAAYGGGAHRRLSPTKCQSARGPRKMTTATSVGLGGTVGNYNGIKYAVSK